MVREIIKLGKMHVGRINEYWSQKSTVLIFFLLHVSYVTLEKFVSFFGVNGSINT